MRILSELVDRSAEDGDVFDAARKSMMTGLCINIPKKRWLSISLTPGSTQAQGHFEETAFRCRNVANIRPSLTVDRKAWQLTVPHIVNDVNKSSRR